MKVITSPRVVGAAYQSTGIDNTLSKLGVVSRKSPRWKGAAARLRGMSFAQQSYLPLVNYHLPFSFELFNEMRNGQSTMTNKSSLEVPVTPTSLPRWGEGANISNFSGFFVVPIAASQSSALQEF